MVLFALLGPIMVGLTGLSILFKHYVVRCILETVEGTIKKGFVLPKSVLVVWHVQP